MKSFAVAAAVFAGVVSAGEWAYPPSNASYTTEILTAYTTYCPGPTQITHGGTTYTVTEATTLTITNCPCTVTYPVITSTYSSCTSCPAPPPPTSVPYSVPSNGTVPAPTGGSTAAPPPATTTPSAPVYTGAATKAVAGSGAAIAALFGLVAYAL